MRDEAGGPAEATSFQVRDDAHESLAERYKKMYDRSSALARIGVWECDLATEALTWTDGVYDLFELPRGAPLDRSEIVKLYEPRSRREMERMRSAAIARGGSFTLDVRIRTARGNRRCIRLTADVETENGTPVRIFGTKQDVTEETAAREKVEALQAELIHASRASAIGAMASTLAHELNQPLSAIANYVAYTRRVLAGDGPELEKAESGLKGIDDCAFRAGRIIRGLRALPPNDAPMRRRVDPRELIARGVEIAASGAPEGLSVEVRLAEGARIAVDPVQLQQVVMNLVRNAIESVECAGRREVVVSSRVAGGAFELSVEDTGPGIAGDALERIFDAFHTSRPDRVGLGLSICRTIVEAHGGRISAANRSTGGACLKVTLPLAPERPEPSAIATVVAP